MIPLIFFRSAFGSRQLIEFYQGDQMNHGKEKDSHCDIQQKFLENNPGLRLQIGYTNFSFVRKLRYSPKIFPQCPLNLTTHNSKN